MCTDYRSFAIVFNEFKGENEEQLRQEISIIEELLGEQPDSRCKSMSLSRFRVI